MPGNKYDALEMVKHITEGNADDVLRRKAAYDHAPGGFPIFLRFVILDVISDPATLDGTKLSHYEHDLKVANIQYATVAPRNSIIARRVMGGDSGASEKVMVLYPFFPPHLAFPAKPGEHVWGMFEHSDAKSNELGYWFCRIVQPNFVEDLNYTHADRQHDQSFLPGLSDVFNGTDDPKYEFKNGVVNSKDGDRYAIPSTATLPDDPDAYKKVLTTSDASQIIQYEAVPRYRKRPDEIAFEGSNNTLIILGTDRTGPISDYSSDPNQGMVPKPCAGDIRGGAGAIDVVVGRGQTPLTAGKAEVNELGRKELGKSKKDLTGQEGDVDFKNDRTRVLLSQKAKPDAKFGIDSVVAAHSSATAINDGSGEGALGVKTDKIRLIARHDVVILVMGATEKDADGNVKDPDANPDNCASVIVRTNGDIVFTPAKKGVIKLGGDGANLSVLCSKAITGNGDGSGQVTAAPIVDSMGGSHGAGATNGEFATKILLL